MIEIVSVFRLRVGQPPVTVAERLDGGRYAGPAGNDTLWVPSNLEFLGFQDS